MREEPLPEVWRHGNVAAEWYDLWAEAQLSANQPGFWKKWVQLGLREWRKGQGR